MATQTDATGSGGAAATVTLTFPDSATTSITTGPIFVSANGATATAVTLTTTTTDATEATLTNGVQTWTQTVSPAVASWTADDSEAHSSLVNQGVSTIEQFKGQ